MWSGVGFAACTAPLRVFSQLQAIQVGRFRSVTDSYDKNIFVCIEVESSMIDVCARS